MCQIMRKSRNRSCIKLTTTPYATHLGTTKMYRDLKKHFWWSRMKRDVVEYMARF